MKLEKNGIAKSLKKFPDGPKLKKDGTPIGGMSLGYNFDI